MKIAVLSDLHLGARMFRHTTDMYNRYELLTYKIFINACKDISSQNPEIVIIPGDVFDNPNPNIASIKTANDGLEILSKNNNIDKILIIGGNHDYLIKDITHNIHPFLSINKFGGKVEYCFQEKDYLKYENNIVKIIGVPYKGILYDENIKNIIAESNTDKFSILFGHGYMDKKEKLYNTQHNIIKEINMEAERKYGIIETDPYAFSSYLVNKYNFSIFGHIHLSHYGNYSNILIPGSIMPSNQANELTENKPSFYILNVLDSKNYTIDAFELKYSPKIYKYSTDDINHLFDELIQSNLYKNAIIHIQYFGKYEDIDLKKFIQINDGVLNLSVETISKTNEQNEKEIKKISKFWEYIKDNKPEWEEEFKNILKDRR